uniref:Uncharacterized protein n=1 Tax=Timema monikensis TaxID=170555 RepID=A0A7R9EI84_9NEOP|nr:unnamed protein product [Timema monikensis]
MLSKTAEDGEIVFRISELKLSQNKIRSRLIGWCFFPFVITYRRPWNEQVISGKFIHLSRWLEDLLPWPCGSTSTSVTGLSNSEEEKLFSSLWSPAQRTSLASTAANLSFSLVMAFTYHSFKMQLVSTFVLFAALMWFSAEATEVKACQEYSEWDVTLLEDTLNEMSRCWRILRMGCHVVGGYSEWDVTLLEGTQNEMSRCWRILRMGCHIVGGYSEWDVTLLEIL